MLSHGLSLNQRTEKQTPNRSNQSPMKKILLLLTCVFTFLLATAEVNYRRPQYRKLPAAAQAFLYQNFPHHRVLDVDYEDNGRYEVELSGDIEIKFNHNGRWIKMESGRRGIPYSALPSIVERRVSERYRYPVRVVQVKRRGDCLDVKLSNRRKMKIYTGRNYPSHNRPGHRYWD